VPGTSGRECPATAAEDTLELPEVKRSYL
jgi:hypothetical protein